MSDEEDIPTPGQVVSNRREMNDPQIGRLRDRCLKALHRSYNGKDDVNVDIDGIDNWVVGVIIEQFTKRGWSCWRDADPARRGQDVTSIVFKAKLG